MITVSNRSMVSPPRTWLSLRRLGSRGSGDFARIHQLHAAFGVVISDHSGALDETVLEGERGGRRPGGDAQLPEDVLDVSRDRVLAEHEYGRDFAVRPAGGDESQDLELAAAEPVRVVRLGPGETVDAAEVRPGGETLEHRPRRLELQSRGVLVLEPTTRLRQQD